MVGPPGTRGTPGKEPAKVRPAPPGARCSEVAVAGIRLADQSRCAVRNELDDDVHQGDIALVSDDVHVAGRFEEARPGREYVGRTGRVVAVVDGRGSRLDDHKTPARVAVAANCPARLNVDRHDVWARPPLRLDLRLPLADLGFGIDLVELGHWRERGDGRP